MMWCVLKWFWSEKNEWCGKKMDGMRTTLSVFLFIFYCNDKKFTLPYLKKIKK